jgi:alkylation response protein AidB-like acyl-CoA dehydrogenase
LVDIVTSSGAITTFTLADGGTQYLVGDTLTITGGNADATFMVANVTDGEITLITINGDQYGTGYNVGDLFGIIGDGNDAGQFELDYVGIGDFTEYNGVQKALTYWL